MEMNLIEKIRQKKVKVGIIGMGYVGLPLVLEFSLNDIKVLGFDIDENKIRLLNKGQSYIRHIRDNELKKVLKKGFKATSDFSLLDEIDAVIICVPTPLGFHREPDLNYIIDTANTVKKYLHKNQLIILVSTTFPGTTEEVVLPILESSGLKAGIDFNLAFSPEREDPGNKDFNTANVPKIVGGYTEKCLNIACELYEIVGIRTVPVSNTRIAEAAKILENTYRAVNIALVNELKMIFDKMDIDIFEVIDAAKTKPFGFQAFYPGPGLGGHCIPIDPFYLAWKAREYDYSTRFIELAGEINSRMPYFIIDKLVQALNENNIILKNAKILILGMAYKKNVDDMRESPSLKLMDILMKKNVEVDYYDPYIPKLPRTRNYDFEKISIELSKSNLKKYDCVIISTAHDVLDKEFILKNSKLILDTRNMFEIKGLKTNKIYKA